MYLKKFYLLDDVLEHNALNIDSRRIYTNYYPFGLFTKKEFEEIVFDNITIFYGDNGSGKSTLLNIIANKLEAIRKTKIDKGNLFNVYSDNCVFEMIEEPVEIKIVTSDDVFDNMLNIRAINTGVNRRKEDLTEEFLKYKYNGIDKNNLEELKKSVDARRKTLSKYTRDKLVNNNIREHSNGENSLEIWQLEINDNSIYILDEPENSLSPQNQIKLKSFIEDSTRFFNCQFIIATHSPFLLNLKGALIYDLDYCPVKTKKWYELENVKIQYNFFKENEKDFD